MNTSEFPSHFHALILGGSSGLGLAAARKLSEKGMHVCVVFRERRSAARTFHSEVLEMQQQGIKVLAINENALSEKGRINILKEIQEWLGEEGRIRLLLHSIARGNLKRMVPEHGKSEAFLLGAEDYALTIQAMGSSLYEWTKSVFDAKLFTKDARVLAFTSEGNTKAWPYYGAVSAAKAVLEAVIRSIAVEMAPYGIRANAVQAGVTDTPSMRMIPGSETLKKHSKIRNPFNRLTTAEDVANVVYLLTKDEAAWINGAIIPVDGGERLS